MNHDDDQALHLSSSLNLSTPCLFHKAEQGNRPDHMIMIIIVDRFNYQTMIIVIMIISPGASSRPAGAISLENKNAQQRFQEQVIIILIMKRTYRNENHHV